MFVQFSILNVSVHILQAYSLHDDNSLLRAIVDDHTAEIHAILADGDVGVDAVSGIGMRQSALQVAIVEGRHEIAKLLIKKRCNLMYTDLVRLYFKN